MRNWVVILSVFYLCACGVKSVEKEQVMAAQAAAPEVSSPAWQVTSSLPEEKSAAEAPQPAEGETDTYPEEYATYYVTIADTGNAYFPIRNEMLRLHQALAQPIDTMRRYYDLQKKMIVLPEDDEDELFAGDYFPRRFPSATLSLEYLTLYQKKAGEETIALVTGIYQQKASADSALAMLKKSARKAFVAKAEIYVGCIH